MTLHENEFNCFIVIPFICHSEYNRHIPCKLTHKYNRQAEVIHTSSLTRLSFSSSNMSNTTTSSSSSSSFIGKLFKRTPSTSTTTPPSLEDISIDDAEFQKLQDESRLKQKQLIAESLKKANHHTESIKREKHIASTISSMKSLVQYLQEKFPDTNGEMNYSGGEIIGKYINKDLRTQMTKGIPPSLRGVLWKYFIGNKLLLNRELFNIYNTNTVVPEAAKNGMVSPSPKRLNFDIDLERTFPALKFFQKGGPMYSNFVTVLECYVKMRPDVGYVQGMSYLVAMLLLYLEEFDAFVCLGNMIQNGCLYGLYKMDSVNSMVAKFGKILTNLYPQLSQWAKKIELEYNMNIIQVVIVDWFFTLFSRSLPLDIAARLWDNYYLWSCCAYAKGLKTDQTPSTAISLSMLGGEWFLYTASIGLLLYFDKTCNMMSMDTEQVLYFLSHLAHFHTLTDPEDAVVPQEGAPTTSRSNMETRVLRFLMDKRKDANKGKLSGKDYELFDEAVLFECIASVQNKLTRKKFPKYCRDLEA
jgi:hypothetical protein